MVISLSWKVTRHADGSVSARLPSGTFNREATPVLGRSSTFRLYVGNNRLSRYDIATDTATSLGRGLPVGPRAWGVNTAGGKPVLTTMGNSSNGPTVVRYDIDGDTLTSASAAAAPAIRPISRASRPAPMASSTPPGSAVARSASTPDAFDLSVVQNGISQAEGSTTIGDTLYWGTYPRSDRLRHRPSQPWKSGT